MILLTLLLILLRSPELFETYTLLLLAAASVALLSLRVGGPLRLFFITAALLDALGFTLLCTWLFSQRQLPFTDAFPWLLPVVGLQLAGLAFLPALRREPVALTPLQTLLRRVASALALGCLFAPIPMMACASFTLYEITIWSGGVVTVFFLALAGYLAPLWSLLSHSGNSATPNLARTPTTLTPQGSGNVDALATGNRAVAV